MSRRWSRRADDPLGIVTNAAIGILDGKIVRVGKRTELAGFRAQGSRPARRRLGHAGADRLPHPFGVRRQPRRTSMRCAAPALPMRRSPRPAAASPRPSPRPRRAPPTELIASARARLHALMAGGCTTVEIKSGYGLDPASRVAPAQRRQGARQAASRCGSSPPCSRSTRLPPALPTARRICRRWRSTR